MKMPDGLPVGAKTWKAFQAKGWTTPKIISDAVKGGAVKFIRGVGKKKLQHLRVWCGLIDEKPKMEKEPIRGGCLCGSPALAVFISRGPLCFECWREGTVK